MLYLPCDGSWARTCASAQLHSVDEPVYSTDRQRSSMGAAILSDLSLGPAPRLARTGQNLCNANVLRTAGWYHKKDQQRGHGHISENRKKIPRRGSQPLCVSQRTSHVAQGIGNLKQIVAVDCSPATGLEIHTAYRPGHADMQRCSLTFARDSGWPWDRHRRPEFSGLRLPFTPLEW